MENNLRETERVDDFINYANDFIKEQIYLSREKAMEEIMNMDKKTFIKKLKDDNLPIFIRSKQGDIDYVKLYRDTNSVCGVEYAYNHRERLRTMSSIDYRNLTNCFPENQQLHSIK